MVEEVYRAVAPNDRRPLIGSLFHGGFSKFKGTPKEVVGRTPREERGRKRFNESHLDALKKPVKLFRDAGVSRDVVALAQLECCRALVRDAMKLARDGWCKRVYAARGSVCMRT